MARKDARKSYFTVRAAEGIDDSTASRKLMHSKTLLATYRDARWYLKILKQEGAELERRT